MKRKQNALSDIKNYFWLEKTTKCKLGKVRKKKKKAQTVSVEKIERIANGELANLKIIYWR